MPKAKTKSKATAKKTTATKYRPSNLSVFVIVLLLVALGTVTWLFLSVVSNAKV